MNSDFYSTPNLNDLTTLSVKLQYFSKHMDLVLVCGQVAVAANFFSTIEYNVIGVFFSSAGNIVFVANDYIGTESCQLQKAFVSFMISTLAVVDLCGRNLGRNAATNPPFFEGGGGGFV